VKILFESYNEVTQNEAGGVAIKIRLLQQYLSKFADVKLFDKWNDSFLETDIIHLFMPTVQNLNTFKLAKKLGKKVVVSAIATPEKKRKMIAKRIINKFLNEKSPYYAKQYIFTNSDYIITETDLEKKFIVSCYGVQENRVMVIPNGVTISEVEIDPQYFKNKTGIENGFVLQVGRFDRNKNQLSTIKAINGTELKLVLIGGPDKDDMDYYEACKKAAGKNVTFLGWVNHDDPLLYSAYKSCHTFILPSFHEILGNAMIEAAALGANVVVTNALPVSEWGIEDLCLTIDPHNVTDIRNKLLESLKKEKDSLLERRIKELFSWDSVVDQHLEVYKKVLRCEL